MANQSLIQAAQRMYSAKAQKTDLTPILQGAASSISNVMNAVAEKRSRQEKESVEKVQKPFMEVIRDNPNVGAQLTSLLEEQQEEYFEQQKLAEGVFRSKSTKEEARAKLTQIETNITNLNKSLSGVDLKQNLVPRNKVSQANSAQAQVMDVTFNDKETLAQNIIIKKDEEGNLIPYIKGTEYKEGEESGLIKLDDYESAIQIHQEGFDALSKLSDSATSFGLKGVDFNASGMEGNVRNEIRKQLQDPNAMSLYFDDFEGFNWAQNQMLDPKEGFENPGVERDENGIIRITDREAYENNLQELRTRVSKGQLEKDGKVLIDYKQELENDLIESFKMVNQDGLDAYDARKQQEQDEFNRRKDPKQFNTAVGYLDEDGVRGLFDDVKNGYVKDYDNIYSKIDGKFYKVDQDGNKLREGSKGITEKQMLSILRISGYASRFGFEASSEEKPETASTELPDYVEDIVDPMGDRDKDGVPNTIDKNRPNIPYKAPTDKSFPGK